MLFFHSRLRDDPAVPELLRNFIGLGHAAVCFFFVLSGFIMAVSNLDRFQDESNQSSNRWNYWLRRIARIYPIYLLGFLLAAAVQYGIAQEPFYNNPLHETASWILRILGLHAWYPPMFFEGPNDPSWSLSVEFLFYALFPLFAVQILKIPAAKLSKHLIFWTALSFVGPLILVANGDNGLKVSTELGEFISFSPPFRVPEFVVGILCGRLYKENLLPTWLKTQATTIFIGGILLLFILVNIGVSAALLRYGITTILFAIIICSMAFQNGAAARVLSTPTMVLLGESSYALYILHRPIMLGIKEATERWMGNTPLWAMVAYVPLAIGISIAAYKWFELPIRDRLNERIKSRMASHPPQPS